MFQKFGWKLWIFTHTPQTTYLDLYLNLEKEIQNYPIYVFLRSPAGGAKTQTTASPVGAL